MTSILGKMLDLPCGARLANRLAKAAMSEGLADGSGNPTASLVCLYNRWASSGAGLLVTGNMLVDRDHLERPGNIVIDQHANIDALRELTRCVAGTNVHLWAQLNHSGRQTAREINPSPLAPSAVPLNVLPERYGSPRDMGNGDIEDVISAFATSARVAQEAGFTGVQIHAAHGYLVSSFLSPNSNLRTDQWGGSLANRARLLCRIIIACRKELGPRFPIAVKLNSHDFQTGGFAEEESRAVATMLEPLGVDLIELSGGTYEKPAMMGAGARATNERDAYFIDYARSLRKVVNLPLMVTGGFRDRQGMAAEVAAGGVDIVGLARPMCIDPQLPGKLIAGRVDAAPALEKGIEPRHAGLAWFSMQLVRLACNRDVDISLTGTAALAEMAQFEAGALARLHQTRRIGATQTLRQV